MPKYQYTLLHNALSNIRVFDLLPGDVDDAIAINLISVLLADLGKSTPFLEALSYVWGDFEKSEVITVGGDNCGSLTVTKNLADALRHLRSPTASRILWADAICINQQDVEERGCQVRLMSEIYSRASRVTIWLGDTSDDSDIAIDCIENIATRVKVNFQTAQMTAITEEDHWADTNVPLPISKAEFTALHSFYSRSWFNRIWVWQEVHLASEAVMICGQRSIPWLAVRTVVVVLGTKPRPGSTIWPAPDNAYSMATFPRTKNFPFRSLLHKTRGSQCSDPRDRVFALLSLLDEDMQARIVPDYNLSTKEVYRSVMVQHFESNHRDGPWLLSTAEPRFPITQSSWIPRWDLPRLTTRFYHSRAALDTTPSIKARTNTVLGARGVRVGTIKMAEAVWIRNDSDQQEMIDEARRLKAIMGLSNEQDLLRFVETLAGNYTAERNYPTYTWRPTSADFTAFVGLITNERSSCSPSDERVLKNVKEFGPGRAFCVTTDGRSCLCPVATLAGDIIVVLLGCDSPIILRPTNSVAPKNWVVGEAFCHGIMEGQALLGPLPDGWNLVIRHDRASIADWPAFWHRATNMFSAEDPRLGDLPTGWTRKWHRDTEFQTLFVNKNDGSSVETWQDPRVTPHELGKRGVKLEIVNII